MRRYAMTPVIAALLIVLTTASSSAQYLTPGGPVMLMYQPCSFELDDVQGGPVAAALWNHYAWTNVKDDVLDNFPAVWVTDFDTACRDRIPWFCVNTHGGVIIEAYAPSGLATRDANYDAYVPSTYSGLQVYEGTVFEADGLTPRMYIIGCNEQFVRSRYRGNRSVVHFSGCNAWNFRSAFRTPTSGQPAYAFLSYDYEVTNTVVQSEGYAIYYNLSGGHGVTKRPLQDAKQGLTIRMDPTTPNIVISPRVIQSSLVQGAHVPAPQTVSFDFDAPMTTGQASSTLIRCEGRAVLNPGTLQWPSSTRLAGTFYGNGQGSAALVLLAYNTSTYDLDGLMSDTGIGLDADGAFPAGEDYRINFVSDEDPWAAVSGFTAVESLNVVTAQWFSDMEIGTAAYQIETAPSPSGPFSLASEVLATKAASYAAAVPRAGFYRLSERDSAGLIRPLAYSWPSAPVVFTPAVAEANQSKVAHQQLGQPATTFQNWTDATDVIFTMRAFQAKAQQLADWKYGVLGIKTNVEVIEDLGGEVMIKPTIASYASRAGRYFLIYGDANDYAYWINPAMWDMGYNPTPNSPAQPQNNLISMGGYIVFPDSIHKSMPFWTKYAGTDWPRIDLDGDGKPDPGLAIGRAPLNTLAEADNFNTKTEYALIRQPQYYPNPDQAFIFSYEWDTNGNLGATVDRHAYRLYQKLSPYVSTSWWSDSPAHWFSNNGRDSLIKAEFNKGTCFIAFAGTVCRRDEWASCLDKFRGATLAGLNANLDNPSFAFVPACGSGDIDRTEQQLGGVTITPLGEDLLLNYPDRGLWGWFGASRATYQYGDSLVSETFLDFLFRYGAPSVGMAAALTVHTGMTKYPEYANLFKTFVFYGDPHVPLVVQRVTTDVPSPTTTKEVALEVPYPNPTSGSATINLTLPWALNVELKAIDIQGRLVLSLLSGRQPAGRTSIQLDLRRLRSGRYFLQLRAGTVQRVQQLTVVH